MLCHTYALFEKMLCCSTLYEYVMIPTPQTYNDIPCVVDKSAESYLVDNGVDPALAYHVAHLFAR